MNHLTTEAPELGSGHPAPDDAELIAKVSEAIRSEIGKRHGGLPKGGWDGLMRNAAVAAISSIDDMGGRMSVQYAAELARQVDELEVENAGLRKELSRLDSQLDGLWHEMKYPRD